MKIGISNLKGGVGKTTISQNLAVCLAHMGYKVCIVDTDRNQNSMAWNGARDEELPQILVVGATESSAINKTVDQLHNDNDIVIIDGTPSLSEITTRVILASDLLIIPILPSAHDVRAMQQFFERYEQAQEFRAEIPAYFFINRFSPQIRIHNSIRELLPVQFELPMMESSFRERVAYIETAVEGKGVFEHGDPKAKAEVVAFTKEIMALAQKHKLLEVSV
ncbi:MAG: ParA family protein [Bacteroidota bacterium]